MIRKCYSVSRSSIDEKNESIHKQKLDCFPPQNCSETYFCGTITILHNKHVMHSQFEMEAGLTKKVFAE